MPEYVANLEDVKRSFVTDAPHPEDMPERAIAFDRLIRQIQDESFEDGYNQRGWETEEF
jgi:hypothetical protein